MKNNKLGFSLLEISIVLLIMGILISGVYSGNYLMRKLKILDTQ
jgi:prepilin-type N-terminal cleavage/methylation domain-containing protein